jgi:hypothetical protein
MGFSFYKNMFTFYSQNAKKAKKEDNYAILLMVPPAYRFARLDRKDPLLNPLLEMLLVVWHFSRLLRRLLLGAPPELVVWRV